MKLILFCVMPAIVFGVFGWLTISSDETSSSVTIETNKIASDTEEFVSDVRDTASHAADEVVQEWAETRADADEATQQFGDEVDGETTRAKEAWEEETAEFDAVAPAAAG